MIENTSTVNIGKVNNINNSRQTNPIENAPAQAPVQSREITCSSSDIYRSNPQYNVKFGSTAVQKPDINALYKTLNDELGKSEEVKYLVGALADKVGSKKEDSVGKTFYNFVGKMMEGQKLDLDDTTKTMLQKATTFELIRNTAKIYATPVSIASSYHLAKLKIAIKNNDQEKINKIIDGYIKTFAVNPKTEELKKAFAANPETAKELQELVIQ